MIPFNKKVSAAWRSCLGVGGMAVRAWAESMKYGIEQYDMPSRKEFNAAWGDLDDVARRGNTGICVDGVRSTLLDTAYANTILFSPSGGGKTATVLLPTALRTDGPSILLFDPSKTMFPLTAPRFAQLGYHIDVLDFSSLESGSINFIAYADSDENAHKVASHLTRTTQEGSKGDPFFLLSATSLLVWTFKMVRLQPAIYHNMANVRHMLNALPSGGLDALVAKTATPTLFSEYKGLIASGSDKTIGSIVLTAQASLAHWASENMCRLTAANTIQFDKYRTSKRICYIHTSLYDAPAYKALNSITIELALKTWMQQVPERGADRPIGIWIDEASTLDLSSLSQVVSNNRKFLLYVLLAYQSPGQLYHAYGKDAAFNILSNCYTKLYLAHQDLQTSVELEQMLGKRMERDGQDRERPVNLMNAQDIRTQTKRQGIMVCGGTPYRLDLLPWFKQPLLQMETEGQYTFHNPAVPAHVPLIPLK